MKSNLMLDFVVDRESRKIEVKREFAAPVTDVWAAWTESELLDQWWAPKPWKARTKSMDFTEGGYWLYAMIGPEGEEHWAKTDYTSIRPFKGFTGFDRFCDSDGITNEEFPQNEWITTFKEQGETTVVDVELTFNTLTDLEQIIAMGFKEGFISALDNLDELLQQKYT